MFQLTKSMAIELAPSNTQVQDKPALTGVDSLAAKLNNYMTSKALASRGVVQRVSEVKKVFTLVRLLRAGYANYCQMVMIVAQLGQWLTTLTQK